MRRPRCKGRRPGRLGPGCPHHYHRNGMPLCVELLESGLSPNWIRKITVAVSAACAKTRQTSNCRTLRLVSSDNRFFTRSSLFGQGCVAHSSILGLSWKTSVPESSRRILGYCGFAPAGARSSDCPLVQRHPEDLRMLARYPWAIDDHLAARTTPNHRFLRIHADLTGLASTTDCEHCSILVFWTSWPIVSSNFGNDLPPVCCCLRLGPA